MTSAVAAPTHAVVKPHRFEGANLQHGQLTTGRILPGMSANQAATDRLKSTSSAAPFLYHVPIENCLARSLQLLPCAEKYDGKRGARHPVLA